MKPQHADFLFLFFSWSETFICSVWVSCHGEVATSGPPTSFISSCQPNKANTAGSPHWPAGWSSGPYARNSQWMTLVTLKRAINMTLDFGSLAIFSLGNIWRFHWWSWHLFSGSHSKIHVSPPVMTFWQVCSLWSQHQWLCSLDELNLMT